MKSFKVEGIHTIKVKRFYLPVTVDVKCPKCNTSIQRCFSDDYLSYPKINEKEMVSAYCDECDCEFEFPTMLKVQLDVYDDEVKGCED